MFLPTDLSSLLLNFFLFRRSPGFEDRSATEKLKDAPIDFSRIRCPLCSWQPNRSSLWFCSDFGAHVGCDTAWNTFDTRGVCPGCNYRWRWTDCLRCHHSSPHDAWYQNESD